MKRYTIGAILIGAVLAFSLAGCGSPAPVPTKSVDADSLKGFWVLEKSSQLGFEMVLNLDVETGEDADAAETGSTEAEAASDGATASGDAASADAEGADEAAASADSASADSASAEASNNFAELMFYDTYLEGTWKTDGKNATINFDEFPDKTASMFVADGKLIVGTADGSKLVFEKGDMEAYFKNLDTEESQEDDPEIVIDENGNQIQTVAEDIKDIDPIKLVDDKNITLTVTGKGTDETGDPGYRLQVKNNLKKPIFISADSDFKVGGKDYEVGLGEIVEVGETVDTFMYFSQNDLGVDDLKNINGEITLGDDDTGDEIQTYPIKIS